MDWSGGSSPLFFFLICDEGIEERFRTKIGNMGGKQSNPKTELQLKAKADVDAAMKVFWPEVEAFLNEAVSLISGKNTLAVTVSNNATPTVVKKKKTRAEWFQSVYKFCTQQNLQQPGVALYHKVRIFFTTYLEHELAHSLKSKLNNRSSSSGAALGKRDDTMVAADPSAVFRLMSSEYERFLLMKRLMMECFGYFDMYLTTKADQKIVAAQRKDAETAASGVRLAALGGGSSPKLPSLSDLCEGLFYQHVYLTVRQSLLDVLIQTVNNSRSGFRVDIEAVRRLIGMFSDMGHCKLIKGAGVEEAGGADDDDDNGRSSLSSSTFVHDFEEPYLAACEAFY